ncbi:unnamed protein product [Symbiodinium sp. CCMP2456]|nr:unnamed protein product [Symbiodinium sp. CCMP2456]
MGTTSASCEAPTASPGCECDKAGPHVKPRLRVGCAIGIAAAPIQFALANQLNVDELAFHLHWVKCPPDADAVLAMLGAGLLDLAILQTEDVVQAVSLGSSLRICGTYTSSPRRFGLYVSSLKAQEAPSEVLRSPCGVLHNCLGAQLAVHMLGQHRDWQALGGLYLRPLSSLEAAKTAIASGRVEMVLWEKYLAYDCVASGEWVEVWQADLPWSSSLFAATKEATYAKAQSVQRFIDWAKQAAEDFLQAESVEDAEKLLASTYRLVGVSVIVWLSSVSWACRCQVRREDLSAALQSLTKAGLLRSGTLEPPVRSLAKGFCALLGADEAFGDTARREFTARGRMQPGMGSLANIFRNFDSNCDGFMTFDDLIHGLADAGMSDLSEHRIRRLFSDLDGGTKGRVSLRQFSKSQPQSLDIAMAEDFAIPRAIGISTNQHALGPEAQLPDRPSLYHLSFLRM